MFLIYHATSRDQVFKGLCDFYGMKFLILSHHFAQFCGHRPCGSSNTATKIVYITLKDHVIKGYGDFKERNSPPYQN